MLTSAHTAMVRRRRAMRMVAALIMGAAIRPRGSTVKPKYKGRPQPGGPCPDSRKPSDHRAPRRRHQPIAIPSLLDIPVSREWIVEALDTHFVGDQHVVDLAAGLFSERGILIEHQMPARIGDEQCGVVRYVGLDEHLVGAG